MQWVRYAGQIRRPIPKLAYLGIAASTFIVPALIWWMVTQVQAVDPIFLPAPETVGQAAVRMSDTGQLWADISMSVFRVTVGFAFAAAVAIPLGILMGNFHAAEAFFEPTIDFIRYMPAAAFIPLIMLYLGIGEEAKIAVIFIGTYFQLVLLVAAGTRSVPTEMINVAYTLGYKRLGVLRSVIIPASLPGMVDHLRITLGWAWTYVVVAEFIAAEEGLGFRIIQSQRFLKTDTIFLYILIIGLLGLIFDQTAKYLSKWTMPWAETFEK